MNTVELPEKVWRKMLRELRELRAYKKRTQQLVAASLGGRRTRAKRIARLEALRDARYWLDDVGIPAPDVARRYGYRSADEMVNDILKHEREKPR